MESKVSHIYAGVSGVTLSPRDYNLGGGVTISQTYAHLMSPWMMAFRPPKGRGPHPAPWKPARGGAAIDIYVQLKIPCGNILGSAFPKEEVVWWIGALVRMAYFPFLSIPVLSNMEFSVAGNEGALPTLYPFETEPRIFTSTKNKVAIIEEEKLKWLERVWIPAGRLLIANPKLLSAFKAFDSAGVKGKSSSALLAIWGGLEQLFAPAKAELRFRVASLLAAYNEPSGENRYRYYKKVLSLYDARCEAAHTANVARPESLTESYVLMRNTLLKIINENRVPSQEELERNLFGL